tara:strand:- start:11 stop:856 length:846 start_codon:yes stop_codon:yes gene_type:complete
MEDIKSKTNLITKMNASIVMNNADLLSHQILPFAVAPIPSCCFKCGLPTPNTLRIFKTPIYNHTFTHKNFPKKYYSLNEIPKEFKDYEELMATVEAKSFFSEDNKHYCEGCWCMTSSFIVKDKIAELIKNANPNFDEKQINREIKLIRDGGLLFKTHRIKKTQEKAKLYEEYVYSALREWFANERKRQKNTAQKHQQSITNYITSVKTRVCKTNSNHWIREIRQRKISKWYIERKISHKFYSFITSQMYNYLNLPTWEKFAENYENHNENENPLPKWWYEL